MEKVKNVKFRLTWKGEGCVNYNGSDSSKLLRKSGVEIPYHTVGDKNIPCENVMYGKCNYYKDDEGNIIRVPKVSSNCIRNAMFNSVAKFNPQTYYNPEIMAIFMSNPAGFLKGHMLTPEKMNISQKMSFTHKSPVMVSDLVSKNGVYNMEEFTSNSFDEDGKRSNTSFYSKETLGETTYTSTVVFDVSRAQFLCLDPRFGKQSIPADVYESGLLEKAYMKKIGRKPYTEGVYTDSSDGFGEFYGEYGYRFDDEYVNYLLNSLIEILWNTKVSRAGGYLELDKIEMYVETDPLAEDKEYVTLEKKDCGTYKFEYESFWNPGTRADFQKQTAEK